MRLLLDTNVWSLLAENGAEDFYRYAKIAKIDVVVAPATLLELLRSPVKSSRQRRVRLICRSRWTRLATEAESESDEIVAEIRRMHPEWMRDSLDAGRLAHLHNLWGNTKWREAREEIPFAVADALSQYAHEKKMMVGIQRWQKERWRDEDFMRFAEDIVKRISGGLVLSPPSANRKEWARQGWQEGMGAEAWRCQLHSVLFHALFGQGRHAGEAFNDWIGIYVDLQKLRAEQRRFGEMLLYHVDPHVMRRSWLRWAVEFAQHAMRIGDGNPVDGQHASYLFDADVFLTCDKRFARLLNEVRMVSPSLFAVTFRLDPRAENLVREIDRLISGLNST